MSEHKDPPFGQPPARLEGGERPEAHKLRILRQRWVWLNEDIDMSKDANFLFAEIDALNAEISSLRTENRVLDHKLTEVGFAINLCCDECPDGPFVGVLCERPVNHKGRHAFGDDGQADWASTVDICQETENGLSVCAAPCTNFSKFCQDHEITKHRRA